MTIPSTGPRWHQPVRVESTRSAETVALWALVVAVGAGVIVALWQRELVLAALVLTNFLLALLLWVAVDIWRVLTAPPSIEQQQRLAPTPSRPSPVVSEHSGRGAWPWS